jgi:hypothetical protein
VESNKVITYQAGDNQHKPDGVALDERVEGITEKADEKEEVEEGKYIIDHELLPADNDVRRSGSARLVYNPGLLVKMP